jgi:hypothetical protein
MIEIIELAPGDDVILSQLRTDALRGCKIWYAK